MKKGFKRVGALLMAAGMVTSMAACGGAGTAGGSDSVEALDIYVLNQGYGDLWATDAIARFKEEPWVKEKYPNLVITYAMDADFNTQFSKLSSGPALNKYDLIFGCMLQELEDTGVLADLTDSVFLTEVPDEPGVRIIDKVPEDTLALIRRANAPAREDGEDTYVIFPYIQALYSFLYNADILEELNLPVPLTTDQFMEVGDAIQENGYVNAASKGQKEYHVIMNAAQDNYWKHSYEPWWAQYEGIQGVRNYYDGYDEVEELYDSRTVLNQTGRLRALEVIEDIIDGYSYESSFQVDYKAAQTQFLMGRGVFHFNGDYFVGEMELELNGLKSQGIDYDIRWMKMPVISSIIEKTPTIEDDQQLRAIIQEIDDNKLWEESQAKVNGVSKVDFEKVAEARMIGGNYAPAIQSAVIPSYAAGKDIAADFLRFMYTDKSVEEFARSSYGLVFPTKYDIRTNEELMADLHPIEMTKFDLLADKGNYKLISLPNPNGSRLGKAGLTHLYFTGSFEGMFIQPEGIRMTPQDILDYEAAYWNQTMWDQMVSRAK